MRRTAVVTVAVLLVVGTLGGLPAASFAQTDSTGGDETVEPGEQFAGVVNVGQAELDGAMEERTFEVRFSQANSSAERAAVVATQVNQSQDRLAELEAQKERLRAARANGSISEGEYRARMARLVAETRTVERMANRTESAARSLPEETLRDRGINVTAIRTLQTNARNMTGPEVAEIARTIAGPGVARPDPGGPAGAGEGRPDRAANESERGPPGGDATERGNSSNASQAGDSRPANDGTSAGDGADANSERDPESNEDGSGQSDDRGQSETEERDQSTTEPRES